MRSHRRRWGPLPLSSGASAAAVVILFLLVVQLFVAAQQQHEEDPQVGLKVTLRKESLEDASSCMHTFAQLELLNLHPTDDIVIHSIQTAPEETIAMVKTGDSSISVDTTLKEGKKYYDVLPQQIKISRLPSSSLSLGPNQVAIVPVSFLPRFPNDGLEPGGGGGGKPEQADSFHGGSGAVSVSSSSSLQALDLEHWLGSPFASSLVDHKQPHRNIQRNNRGMPNDDNRYDDLGSREQYQVRTTVLVETSKGVLKLPIHATSKRTNDYGLPDSISFSVPRTGPSGFADGEGSKQDKGLYENEKPKSRSANERLLLERAFRVVERTIQRNNTSKDNDELGGATDCFDLYIRHPHSKAGPGSSGSSSKNMDSHASIGVDGSSNVFITGEEDLNVLEVLVSMPEHVTLSIIPEKDREAALHATSPRQIIRKWSADESSPRVIPRDGQLHYLVTICSSAERINKNEVAAAGRDGEVEEYLEEVSPLIEPTNEATWLGFLQVRTDMDTLFVGLESGREEVPIPKAGVSAPLTSTTAYSRGLAVESADDKEEKEPKKAAVMSTHPESIDINLISSASPKARIPIDIHNTASSKPITIMRVSAVFNASTPGLDEKVGLDLNLLGRGLDEPIPIPFNETLKGAFFFECSINWDMFMKDHSDDTAEFTGTVILRGTSSGWVYADWEAAVKANPSLDSELVVEVPFSIKLVKGKIVFFIQGTSHPYSFFWSTQSWHEDLESVTSAFFPLSLRDMRASLGRRASEELYSLRTMDHQIRVLSNVDIKSKVKKVEIVDDKLLKPLSSSSTPESLCSRFKASFSQDDGLEPINIPNHTECGLIRLKYRFPTNKQSLTKGSQSDDGHTSTCFLKLTTDPDTGAHLIPLVMYSGQIDVMGSQLRSNSQKDDQASLHEEADQSFWQTTVVGFEKLLAWLQKAKAGSALFGALDSFTDLRRSGEKGGALLDRYLHGLSLTVADLDQSMMQPILLQAGAIAQGEMETIPLYLTNYNPLPMEATIEVGEVEGMSIAVAREQSSHGKGDGNRLLDYLPPRPKVSFVSKKRIPEPRINSGPFAGHPVNGLRQFLLTDEHVASVLKRFSYRDAVSLSEAVTAQSPLLEGMFTGYGMAEFHKDPIPKRYSAGAWSRCDEPVHPPTYGPFENKLGRQKHPGPVIVSNDGKSSRHLSVCWDRIGAYIQKQADPEDVVLIPPGGAARFDVQIRSLPNAALEKDITEFLATGLVLSTNHGEVLPIFVSFEALQGKLDVVHMASSSSPATIGSLPSQQEGTIHVPAGLFEHPSPPTNGSKLRIPPAMLTTSKPTDKVTTHNARVDGGGVSLFMKSSFSRDVLLREVYSCNPWFEVLLGPTPELSASPVHGFNIGTVKSTLPCTDLGNLPSSLSGHPSFFRCCLSWLVNRAILQPQGCGVLPINEKRTVDSEGNQVAVSSSIERAIRTIKRAILVSEHANGSFPSGVEGIHNNVTYKSNRRSSDGVVPQVVVDAIADAWDAWRTISELRLNAMSTSLRAIIEYNSTVGEKLPKRTHVLSVALRNLTVESVLEAPRLFDSAEANQQHNDSTSFVEFPPTPLAQVASVRLPLHNPTPIPLRVRLAVLPSKGVEGEKDPLEKALGVEDVVRKSFTGSLPSPYVQTQKTKQQASNRRVLRDNWWDEVGGFFLDSVDGDIIRSHHNVTIIAGAHALVSLYNPSLLASTAFLLGCGSRCGIRDDVQTERRIWSPIGASAALGSTISGRKRSSQSQNNQLLLGSNRPVFSAGGSLHSGGDGPPPFAIPFSALDEVIIPPFGEAEIGPILFRPPGRFTSMGCQSLKEAGLGGGCEAEYFESAVFLENSMSGLERVILKGKGQLERIDFVDPEPLDRQEFGNVELRYGFPALMFPGTAESYLPGKRELKVTVREVVVQNSGDLPVRFLSAFLSHTARLHETAGSETSRRCTFRNFQLVDCESLHYGFSLLPGQNRSVFIKHFADCRQRKDFISLHLEIDRRQHRQAPHFRYNGTSLISPNRSSGASFVTEKLKNMNSISQSERAELLVGYDMPRKEFSSCVPTPSRLFPSERSLVEKGNVYGSLSRFEGSILGGSGGGNAGALGYSIAVVSLLLACLFATIMTMIKLSQSRLNTYFKFHAILNSSKLKPKSQSSPTPGSNWFAAFRCLARADPTSVDLQTLGREQVRQIVLARYRSLGVLQPQCLNSAGAFQRDRGGSAPKPGRQMTTTANREGGNDRIRSLSDATFRNFKPRGTASSGHFPCDLGWRTPAAKGIIGVESLQKMSFVSKTEALLNIRHQQLQEEEEEESSSSSSSSSGESSEEEEESMSTTSSHEEIVQDQPSQNIVQSNSIIDDNFKVVSQHKKAHVDAGDIGSTSNSTETPEVTVNVAGSGSNGAGKPNHKTPPVEKAEPKQSIIPKKTKDTTPSNAKKPEAPVKGKQERVTKTAPRKGTAGAKAPKQQERRKALKNATSSPPKPTELLSPAPVSKSSAGKDASQQASKAKHPVDSTKKIQDSKKGKKKKSTKTERTKKVQTQPQDASQAQKMLQSKKPQVASPQPQANAWIPKAQTSPAGSSLRPPPGLPPPPGFQGSKENSPSTQLPVSADKFPSLSGSKTKQNTPSPALGPVGTPDRASLSAPPESVSRTVSSDSVDFSLGGTSLHSAERAPTQVLYDTQRTVVAPQYGGEDEATDFDIMNFLDGVLNDTSVAEEDENDQDRVEESLNVSGELQLEDAGVAGVPLISSNPWATPMTTQQEGRSRLSAYGISIEDGSERTSDPVNLPLLTPADILSAAVETEQPPDEEENYGGSFYANLLGNDS